VSASLRRLVPAAAVLLALAIIGAAAALIKSAPTTAPSTPKTASSAIALTRQAAITTAIRACPPGTNGVQDRVALFASSSGSGGGAVLTPLPQAGVRIATARQPAATTPGALSLLPVSATATTSKQQAWSIAATGAMAQGAEAEVADSSGLASVRCGEPGSDIWFVGPGQQDGVRQVQLDLMNVDSLPATVNVNVITDAGVVQSGNVTGITVPPRGLVTESLSSQAGGASVVAIEVRTSAGRVAADVSESSSHGTASWVPSAASPSTRLVIPGVPPSGSAASLFLVVPGNSNARVNVIAVTSQGHYQPFGSQSIDLPGQSASNVQLTPLGGTAAALQITANVPVTAAVLVPGSGFGTFTAAAAPIAEQAVIAGNTSGGGFAASVALTAPGTAARVRLAEFASGAATATGTSQLVTVPAGHTLSAPVKAPPGSKRGAAFTVVITPLPGSGPLYAARVETQGQNTVVSIIAANSALTTVGLPPVRDSYTAIWP
jgi:hypothetical protein